MTPDTLPVIGAVREGLVVATGHGSFGVTLAAGTAPLVAAAVLGQEPPFDPGPFRPDRFPASAAPVELPWAGTASHRL
jgi:D-amino-acid dehydrogenase